MMYECGRKFMLVHQIIIIFTKELHQKHYLLFYYTLSHSMKDELIVDELYRMNVLYNVAEEDWLVSIVDEKHN